MWFFLCCMFFFSSTGNDFYLNTQFHLQRSLSYMCSSFLQERFLCMLHALSSHHYWWHTSQFLKKNYNIYNSLEERFIIFKYLKLNFFNCISLQPVYNQISSQDVIKNVITLVSKMNLQLNWNLYLI